MNRMEGGPESWLPTAEVQARTGSTCTRLNFRCWKPSTAKRRTILGIVRRGLSPQKTTAHHLPESCGRRPKEGLTAEPGAYRFNLYAPELPLLDVHGEKTHAWKESCAVVFRAEDDRVMVHSFHAVLRMEGGLEFRLQQRRRTGSTCTRLNFRCWKSHVHGEKTHDGWNRAPWSFRRRTSRFWRTIPCGVRMEGGPESWLPTAEVQARTGSTCTRLNFRCWKPSTAKRRTILGIVRRGLFAAEDDRVTVHSFHAVYAWKEGPNHGFQQRKFRRVQVQPVRA